MDPLQPAGSGCAMRGCGPGRCWSPRSFRCAQGVGRAWIQSASQALQPAFLRRTRLRRCRFGHGLAPPTAPHVHGSFDCTHTGSTRIVVCTPNAGEVGTRVPRKAGSGAVQRCWWRAFIGPRQAKVAFRICAFRHASSRCQLALVSSVDKVRFWAPGNKIRRQSWIASQCACARHSGDSGHSNTTLAAVPAYTFRASPDSTVVRHRFYLLLLFLHTCMLVGRCAPHSLLWTWRQYVSLHGHNTVQVQVRVQVQV